MPKLRLGPGLVNLFASVEERARVRLHQAANRMEDAEPLRVRADQQTVRVLDVIDRVTGFRALHRASRVLPEGRRAVVRPPSPTPRPELDGMEGLDQETRLRLREAYRSWERQVRARGGRVVDPAQASGGGLSDPLDAEVEAAWRVWRELVASARAALSR